MLIDFIRDITFSLRVLRKSLMVSLTIVLCLGFSIGATATVIAWMEGLVFRPLRGVPEPDRLFSLKMTTPAGDQSNFSYRAYRDLRDESRAPSAFGASLTAFGIRRLNLRLAAETTESNAEPVWGVLAAANYFDVLHVPPAIGRGFLPGEDVAAGGAPVAVIGHELWQRRFGGDPAVIGRALWANGQQLTIVGVAPPGFTGTLAGLAFDLWTPVAMQPLLAPGSPVLDDRSVRWLGVFGRLAPGATLRARPEISASFLGAEAPGSQGARREHAGRM